MTVVTTLNSKLLLEAANNRHGLVLRPQTAFGSKSDVESVIHVGVPASLREGWKSASGGVAFDETQAHLAAVGESVERYCAGIAQIEQRMRTSLSDEQRIDAEDFSLFSGDQRAHKDFPSANTYSEECKYSEVFHLQSNESKWVPHPLVVLRDEYETGLPTSSGLAAGTTTTNALLRATQELIERDALMTTWLHSLTGRAIEMPSDLLTQASHLCGEVYAFDLTPSYSPFPVIAVAGGIPQRGNWRFSLGVACRETIGDAVEKAFLEWCQGVFFAGIYPRYVDTTDLTNPHDVRSFDEHAIYYTQNPQQWEQLPLLREKTFIHEPQVVGEKLTPHDALKKLVTEVSGAGIDLYYRDLTTIDALQAGVRVVRVLSPHLVPIHSHHAWPFLGGTAFDLETRYPQYKGNSHFPNVYPHPLG